MIVGIDITFRNATALMNSSSNLVVDLETDGLKPWHGNRLCGVAVLAFHDDGEEAFYFPFRHGEGFNLPLSLMPELMRTIAACDCQIGFNYKFDMQFMLQEEGYELPEVIEDVLLAAHLMNENEPTFKLKELGRKYIGEDAADEQTALYEKLAAMGYRGKGAAGHMWRLPATDVAPYALQDVRLTWALREFYRPHLVAWRLWDLYLDVCDYQLITTKMEVRGLLVNTNLCQEYAAEADAMVGPMTEALHRAAGYAINPKSHKQVCAWLDIESSRAEVLDEIAADPNDPAAEDCKILLKYRAWSKVNDTYYHRYLAEVDGRSVLRSSLNITGTISGRLSSSGPNLQAVPVTDEVYKVKNVFVARPGYVLVSADYSQAELRLACHYTQDENLLAAFANNEDIHQMTADLCKIERNYAKRINFGVVYGIGGSALGRQLKMPEENARALLQRFHRQFPGYKRLYRQCERMAEERGYIRMWTGRCRRYDSKNPAHKASSNLIQGGVAEMMRVTILKLSKWCPQEDVHMLLQVHDQIIFEVPEDKVHRIIPRIRSTMMDLPFTVPMKVDIAYGPSWGNLTTAKEEINA